MVYLKQKQLLKDLGQQNKNKRVNMIEEQIENVKRKERIRDNCRKVRDWVKRKENGSRGTGSVQCDKNKENFDFNYNGQGNPTDDLIQMALETNKIERVEESKKVISKPKWAYSKKEYDDFIAEGEDCEDFMDNLNFDNFIDNLEDDVVSKKESENEEQEKEIEAEIENDDYSSNSINNTKEDLKTKEQQKNLLKLNQRRHKHQSDPETPTEQPYTDPEEIANLILCEHGNISKIHSKQSIVQILKKSIPSKATI